MKRTLAVAVVGLVIAVCGVSFAAERTHAVGFGVVGGSVEGDTGGDEIEFSGGMVFGKFGFTENWGLMLSFRDMEDDEDLIFGGSIDYTQIGVHAVYMWRPDATVRPHVKFGLAQTDADVEIFGFTGDDDEVTVSVGGGFEAGSEKVAFYLDLDYTEVELAGADFEVGNLTAGVLFKF